MTTVQTQPRPAQPSQRANTLRLLAFPLMAALLLLVMVASTAFGAAEIEPRIVAQSVTQFDDTNTSHLVIRNLRMPRAVTAALVGAALAVAGAVMQGLTRNPLADSGLLGIEAGAALAVMVAVLYLGVNSLSSFALFAFVGAGVSGAAVYAIGSVGRGGPTPIKLTIAGAALGTMLASITSLLAIMHPLSYDQVRFWMAGSVAGREMELIAQGAVYILIGLVLAILLGRQITTLSLGDDIARSLGLNVLWVKLLSALAVVVLAGTSVSLAGPIGFVGLVAPHAVRFFTGPDYRWVIPYGALLGAIFMVVADVVSRVVMRPMELPVGLMTAAIGGPIFIYLVRAKVKR
ncbi:MAG: iron ABC transporter permease [Anaerolineales bacterium]|nr:MAG: iron ABC transporter permease [Anaerolineales bacterium]